jgi:hypothetical protein
VFEDRVKVIRRSSAAESAISIAGSFNVGKTQIQNIIKEKESVLARREHGERGDRKIAKERKCLRRIVHLPRERNLHLELPLWAKLCAALSLNK